MSHYVQPSRPPLGPQTRSRGSSIATKYTPDGYPIPPQNTEPTPSNDYLAPSAAVNPHTYDPPRPEQYRPPPAAYSGAVPPAHVPPTYVERKSDGYGERPHAPRRHGSVDSRHSTRSHKSHRSTRSHASGHSRHDGEGHHHRGDGHRDSHGEKRHPKHHEYDDEDDLHYSSLKRKDTHRPGFGGTLFSLFEYVKDAVKGY